MVIVWCLLKIFIYFKVVYFQTTGLAAYFTLFITLFLYFIKLNDRIEFFLFNCDRRFVNTLFFQRYLEGACFCIYRLLGKYPEKLRIRDYITMVLEGSLGIFFLIFFFSASFETYEFSIGNPGSTGIFFICAVFTFLILKSIGWFLAILGFMCFYFRLNSITCIITSDNTFILNQAELMTLLSDLLIRLYPVLAKDYMNGEDQLKKNDKI
jgi:hypothetical protein